MQDQKKYFVRSVKFNQEQNDKLKKILNQEGVNFSDLVKSKIFDDDQKQKQKYIKRLKLNETLNQNRSRYDLIDQLKRIGNNLNQISHNLNRQKDYPISIQIGIEIQKIRSEIERLKNDS